MEITPFSDLLKSSQCADGSSRSTEKDGSGNERLKKACQDFESIFVYHLLKSMRSTVPDGDGLMGKGMGGDIYRDMFDQEVAKKISEGKGIGLAQRLYRDLERAADPIPQPIQDSVPSEGAAHSEMLYRRIRPYHASIIRASRQYGVDPALLYAMVGQESGGNPDAVSVKGAKGLMQLMDATAEELGVADSFDPDENIRGGAEYMRRLLDRFDGDVKTALAAYNAGIGAVEKYGGVPPYEETTAYVSRVLDLYGTYWQKFGMNQNPYSSV